MTTEFAPSFILTLPANKFELPLVSVSQRGNGFYALNQDAEINGRVCKVAVTVTVLSESNVAKKAQRAAKQAAKNAPQESAPTSVHSVAQPAAPATAQSAAQSPDIAALQAQIAALAAMVQGVVAGAQAAPVTAPVTAPLVDDGEAEKRKAQTAKAREALAAKRAEKAARKAQSGNGNTGPGVMTLAQAKATLGF